MDGTRFDTWTRRRFGLATFGAAASLLGLGGHDGPAAAARRSKQRCRRLGQHCDATSKQQTCCHNRNCTVVLALGSGTFCCKGGAESCATSADCCHPFSCDNTGHCKF